eukprot:gene5721-4082_t
MQHKRKFNKLCAFKYLVWCIECCSFSLFSLFSVMVFSITSFLFARLSYDLCGCGSEKKKNKKKKERVSQKEYPNRNYK